VAQYVSYTGTDVLTALYYILGSIDILEGITAFNFKVEE
jgi:hypothetical protein